MPSKEDFKSYGIGEYSTQDEAPYTLGNLSSKGSVGEVYKGVEKRHNSREGRIVAIKRIKLFETKKEDQIHAARECRILRNLDHPNIVKFEAAYHVEAEELLFLVMSPWAPVTLLDFIEDIDKNNRSSKCPWYSFGFLPPMVQIIQQLMEGLNYLHTRNAPIKHKDLKPPNILLYYTKGDPFVRPIIIDFNISKEIIPGMHTTYLYTHMYQAPEQIGGKPTTPKSDVFSLGCCLTLIEGILLAGRLGVRKVHDAVTDNKTGQFATSTDDVNEILDNMINKFFPKESESCPDSATASFHKGLRQLVKRMVASKPDSRPRISKALHTFKELEALVQPKEKNPPREERRVGDVQQKFREEVHRRAEAARSKLGSSSTTKRAAEAKREFMEKIKGEAEASHSEMSPK